MLTNIFFDFDPCVSSFFNPLNQWLSWILIFFTPLFFPLNFWLKPSKFFFFIHFLISIFHKEFYNNSKKKFSLNLFLIIAIFYFIFSMNFFGMMPYTFSLTAHHSINFPLSSTLFMAILTYSFFNFPMKTLAHFIPIGTPFWLTPFMILIELISMLIRPMTLMIRLTTNIITGHLVMELIGDPASYLFSFNSLNLILGLISSIIFFILYSFEISMTFGQSYIFCTLVTLYCNE